MSSNTTECDLTLARGIAKMCVGITCGCCVLCVSVVTIVTIWRTPTLHNNSNYFLASAAVCDILAAATCISLSLFYMTRFHEYFKHIYVVNTFILGVSYTSMFSSVLHLTVSAIDRYIYILHPFCYIKYITRNYTIKLLCFIWVSTLMYIIIPVVTFRYNRYQTALRPQREFFIVSLAIDATLCVVMCVCYFRIAYVAFERKRARRAQLQRRSSSYDNNLVTTNWRAAVKSTKFFVVMFGAIFICFSPFIICIQLISLGYTIPRYLAFTSLYVFHIQPVLNFLVNFKMNVHFRSGINKLVLSSLPICGHHHDVPCR